MEINESSCLHVRDFDFHTLDPNRAPPPHMSIFNLVKGEKRTRSVRNANVEEGRPEWLRIIFLNAGVHFSCVYFLFYFGTLCHRFLS